METNELSGLKLVAASLSRTRKDPT